MAKYKVSNDVKLIRVGDLKANPYQPEERKKRPGQIPEWLPNGATDWDPKQPAEITPDGIYLDGNTRGEYCAELNSDAKIPCIVVDEDPLIGLVTRNQARRFTGNDKLGFYLRLRKEHKNGYAVKFTRERLGDSIAATLSRFERICGLKTMHRTYARGKSAEMISTLGAIVRVVFGELSPEDREVKINECAELVLGDYLDSSAIKLADLSKILPSAQKKLTSFYQTALSRYERVR